VHQTELFGPVLGVMCARNLQEAIEFANSTPYGLTAGLHSLDPREHAAWISKINAGNLYINRGITGAIVARQPFGGCKASSFGLGMKAGFDNYILQFFEQSDEQTPYQKIWNDYFTKNHPLQLITGQNNSLFFRPHQKIFFFLQESDDKQDVALVTHAAAIAGTELIIGGTSGLDADTFTKAILATPQARIRTLSPPPQALAQQWAKTCSIVDTAVPSLDGLLELLHFVREISLSYDYHRYGNLTNPSNDSPNGVSLISG
jgi:RHH-type proline utilization regulon transcriptional repressor/proline dehydrogenase/delta 1-pyrroline-5-carboxylate dehydrogenase